MTHELDAVMHFAAWLSVGESVAQSGRLLPQQRRRRAVGAGRDGRRGRSCTSCSRPRAAVFGNPEQTPITEVAPERPINAYGETKLAFERALPHYERAYGLRSIALRYFNAAGADPEGELGEDHAPEIHVIPRAIDAALGRGRFQIFGDDYATPDGTCLRDYVHVTDLAAAHVLALDALRAGARLDRLQPRQRPADSVRDVVDAVERVTGRQVPYDGGAAARGRSGRSCSRRASAIRRELGWQPQVRRSST